MAADKNVKRTVTFLVFALGLILLIVGATTTAYSTMTGVIIFLCFLFASFALRILWNVGKEKA